MCSERTQGFASCFFYRALWCIMNRCITYNLSFLTMKNKIFQHESLAATGATAISRISRLSLFCPVILCLAVAGCGGEPKPDGLPKLYPVTLTFTQNGEPCADAIVTLVPVSDSPWGTGGITNANGNVRVQTHGKFPGAPAGKYKITVSKTENGTAGQASANMFATQTIQTFNLIDPVYAVSSSTPLDITVEAGKNKTPYPPFDLGAKVREPVRPPGM